MAGGGAMDNQDTSWCSSFVPSGHGWANLKYVTSVRWLAPCKPKIMTRWVTQQFMMGSLATWQLGGTWLSIQSCWGVIHRQQQSIAPKSSGSVLWFTYMALHLQARRSDSICLTFQAPLDLLDFIVLEDDRGIRMAAWTCCRAFPGTDSHLQLLAFWVT